VAVPQSVIDLVVDLRSYLQDKCEPPVYVSDRRLVKAINIMQVAFCKEACFLCVSIEGCRLAGCGMWGCSPACCCSDRLDQQKNERKQLETLENNQKGSSDLLLFRSTCKVICRRLGRRPCCRLA
jgi:AAA lid domain